MAQMTAETFINNLLSELIDQIVNGKDKAPKEKQAELKDKTPFKEANFLTWCTPGIPVTSKDFACLTGLRKPLDPAKNKDLPENKNENQKRNEAQI